MAEGVAAELVSAFASGAALTAWALYLGCSTLVVGVIAAIPFLAQVVQLPGAWLTSTFGARRVALVTVGLARQMFWPLVLLPWAPISPEAKRGILIAVAMAHHGFGMLCNNAWVSWMGDLVPARIRGRYFGRRNAICTLASAAATFATGLLLDHGRAAQLSPEILAGLAMAACLAGAASTWLMSLKHNPGSPAARPFEIRTALRPLQDPLARRFLAYQIAWNAAVGLAAPFFGIYLLRDLRLGFALMTAHTASVAIARTISAPRWGRGVDRVGARPVLVVCCLGIAASPFLWSCAGPDRLWPLALDAVLGGILLGGHGVAAFALPLAVAPRAERPFYLALFAMTGGAAYALATALGGTLAEALPPTFTWWGHSFVALQVIFLLSVAARLLATVVAFRVSEPDSRSVRELYRVTRMGLSRWLFGAVTVAE